MMFCEECRIKREWPGSEFRTTGRCEGCGNVADCHEVPADQLPPVWDRHEREAGRRIINAQREYHRAVKAALRLGLTVDVTVETERDVLEQTEHPAIRSRIRKAGHERTGP